MKSLLNAIKIEKNVPIPLYYQLKKQILGMIDGGVLKEGDMITPENELCEMLNVSRPTVRQAFSELVSEGYLVRYKGKGTYVSKPKLEEQFLSKLETFNNEMTAKGLTPRTRVLALERLTGPHEASEKLQIPLDAPLIYLSRLRSADEVPLVYVETFLAYDTYAKLMELDFGEASLYESLETLYNTRIIMARREIEAINARRREASLLQIAVGKAINLVKTVAFGDDFATPIEYSVARYRGDLSKFSINTFR